MSNKEKTLELKDIILSKELESIEFTTAPAIESGFIFEIEDETILELRADGDVLYKGKLIENDKQILKGLREFLEYYGLYRRGDV